MVNCQLRNDFKGRARKMGVFEGGGGGGGLTWPLILRIFGMVSITFFFAPPPLGNTCKFYSLELAALQYNSLRVICRENLTVWQLAAIVVVSKVSSSADKICLSEAFSWYEMLADHASTRGSIPAWPAPWLHYNEGQDIDAAYIYCAPLICCQNEIKVEAVTAK